MRQLFQKTMIMLFITLIPFFSIAQLISGNSGSNDSEARKMFKQAEKLWKQDKYLEAEKLYFKANKLAPSPSAMNDFALNRMKIMDINGANRTWDELIDAMSESNSITSYEMEQTYYLKATSNFKTGDPIAGVSAAVGYIELLDNKITMSQSGMATAVFSNAPKNAFYLDDLRSLERMYAKAKTLKNAKFVEFTSDVYIKLLKKQFGEAIKILEEVASDGGDFFSSKAWAKYLLPEAYALSGDYVKAMERVKFASKNLLARDKDFTYIYGLNALNNKDYPEAIKNFTIAIKQIYSYSSKYNNYTKRAESNIGLGDLIQARKDYESALIYNPSYEPAINGIAKLEGKMIIERKADKMPPVIVITEPALARGLIITGSGNDIMVKGMATDPSGLKSVSINGAGVYSKEGGDFWGGVQLKDGMNKILIVATDLAGNVAEHIFEIEKPITPTANNKDIIPVQEKEGRNFAVLVAAQNYDDQGIPSLNNPIADAVRLKLILKNNYNFLEDNIITLFNPDRSDFRKKFLDLSELIQPEDNLIIFYAGHGIWVDKEKKGYWLLTDAKRNDVNTWLPNKEVLNMIAELASRHTLLITDACFSGSVFKTRGLGKDAPAAMKEMDEKISRVAITSGNDTEVPDESVFMKYLVKALSENKEKYLTAQKMFINQIIEAVMTETKTEPRYGTLELAGHVGGDYIFIKK